MICFYDKDIDSICAAAILKLQFYDAKLIKAKEFFDIDYLNRIMKHHIKIYIINHEFETGLFSQLKTAYDVTWIYKGKVKYRRNPERSDPLLGSSSEIMWKLMFPESKTPVFIKYLSEYSILRLTKKEKNNFKNNIDPFYRGLHIFNLYPEEREFWINMFKNKHNEVNQIISAGKIINSYEKNKNNYV